MVVLWIDIMVSLLKDEEGAKEKIGSLERSGERISTTPITAYELLNGAQISSRSEGNLAPSSSLEKDESMRRFGAPVLLSLG
jgi:hypothetical protein